MQEFYFVHTKTDAQGDYEVHTENCNKLPTEENREYLGTFDNCADAVREAKHLGYAAANGCYFCCTSCHTS
ncbi:hypothetical protein KDN34_08725 [Shewanella yunxiaonensis]|uniref:Uncharacterized protein n=1 Tax=Shewanella yunxiaonensis TaxID=2829809 RepID=A0ABX7YXP5_9GAMM|nr:MULTISPECIES: hypothetical protein [Shewanella]MDF0535993.1 hypothetical protein [Shewanella sp. A32]QUN07462.1 hypothetical protein KDN34_08725 [Shewanella yunxiaonensis]